VISPEGCAAILWKSGDKAAEAAEALKLTGKDLLKLGLIDKVIDEPLGGAHRDPRGTIERVKAQIVEWLGELQKVPVETLLEQRYAKFRHMGVPLGA
jgi:acetyl-CoA carboxylase carboxyl transferase subunit alpha